MIFTPPCQQFDHRSTAAIQSALGWEVPFQKQTVLVIKFFCCLELSDVTMELLLENCVRDVSEYRTGQCAGGGHSQVVL